MSRSRIRKFWKGRISYLQLRNPGAPANGLIATNTLCLYMAIGNVSDVTDTGDSSYISNLTVLSTSVMFFYSARFAGALRPVFRAGWKSGCDRSTDPPPSRDARPFCRASAVDNVRLVPTEPSQHVNAPTADTSIHHTF